MIVEQKMRFEVTEDNCPKAVYDELLGLESITANDIGIEDVVSNKTADWLAEHTNDTTNGEFVEYEIGD